jgi:hypothetical protein
MDMKLARPLDDELSGRVTGLERVRLLSRSRPDHIFTWTIGWLPAYYEGRLTPTFRSSGAQL